MFYLIQLVGIYPTATACLVERTNSYHDCTLMLENAHTRPLPLPAMGALSSGVVMSPLSEGDYPAPGTGPEAEPEKEADASALASASLPSNIRYIVALDHSEDRGND
ncbi:uncharacterized protein PHACADRAFT_192545 [Phanerochaete carnosa HHB-10118-sp]|uniref:Uncharacterized protein n=1 Tax=Phanerochaete carnosa (strain HHB-10118-sp) TaxID=650164 RepID=K5WL40_PHACS|nr:uncharacterized protein PHACADRAFT_192545 [Phanerochaete carnosa HHB-10118-sp]EKM60145.1 hypothetical protein PHACADRAFT_192545 [Phanerochaete carnosa HHB-10118-sp]